MDQALKVISNQIDILDTDAALQKLVDQFLASIDVNELTKSRYRSALRFFQSWLLITKIKNPKHEDILQFKKFLHETTFTDCTDRTDTEEKNYSALTQNITLVAVRRFFGFLEEKGIYPNVARNVKGVKRPRGFRKEALTRDEIKLLLQDIKKETICSAEDFKSRPIIPGSDTVLRDYSMINLMALTGLRTCEIQRALVGDLGRQQSENVLNVWGKGRSGPDDFVVLTAEAYDPLRQYLAARGNPKPNESLFASVSNQNKGALSARSIRRIVADHLKAAGLKSPKITTHSLRHSFATNAIQNGANIVSVKNAMRHSSIDTTMIYVHSIDRIKSAAERFVSYV